MDNLLRKGILIVDDDKGIIDSVKMVVEGAGFNKVFLAAFQRYARHVLDILRKDLKFYGGYFDHQVICL